MGRRYRSRRFVAVAVALCGLAGLARGASSTPAGESPPPDLAQYRGKLVYVDFWASWCVPCRQSFPWMNNLQRQYGGEGLVVLAVNMDQVRAEADAFLKQYPAQFTVSFDPRGQLAQQYKVRGMPTSVLIGRDGRLLWTHEGFRSKDPASLEQSIRKALQ